MVKFFRPFVAFLLNDNIGRGLVAMAILILITVLARSALAVLPAHLAGLILRTAVLGAIGIVVARYIMLRALGRIQIFIGTGSDLQRVLSRMPTANRSPQPPIWAFGRHMQFVPWIMYNLFSSGFAPLRYETQILRVFQLVDKTKPESKTNPRSMDDNVVINYFPPTAEAKRGHEECSLPLDAPAILIDPGLTCNSQDVPGSSLLRRAVSRGFRVVVMDRRGHAHPLEKPRWNLFGDSDDLEQIVTAVRNKLPDAPLFWAGISSGTKLPIEAMGKFDQRRSTGDPSAPKFVATACICPGYNLETCFMGFGFPYKKICLSSTKSKFLETNESVLREFDSVAYEKAANATDLQSLLSHIAPFAGYPSSEEYFQHENPVLFAPLITTPTLIINSLDDPCTVARNAFGKMPGRDDGLTFVDMVRKSPCGLLLLSPSGSHCPFLDGGLWPFVRVPKSLGSVTIASWADACILEFFEGYLEERRARNVD